MAHETTLEMPAKKSLLPMLIGVVLMLLIGAGAFYALYSGLVFTPSIDGKHDRQTTSERPDIAYVVLDPMVISLTESNGPRHLRFAAQIEVSQGNQPNVELVKPRIVDILNGYLRAVDPAELSQPNALIRMRAQMLRRIQIVTGDGRVRDLLITEFVLN